MSMANQVTYRDLDPSTALNAIIDKRIRKLERYANNIQSSRVVLESPHNHKHKGKHYRATIEIDMKGKPITVSQNDPSIHIAVRDAFNVAERKLKDCVQQLQSKRKRGQSIDIIEDDDLDVVA